MAWFGTKFEQNCWRIEPGLSAYSSQQQEKAERQQKTSRVQFCSNLVPNHFTGLLVAPRSLADSVHWLVDFLKKKQNWTKMSKFQNLICNQQATLPVAYPGRLPLSLLLRYIAQYGLIGLHIRTYVTLNKQHVGLRWLWNCQSGDNLIYECQCTI